MPNKAEVQKKRRTTVEFKGEVGKLLDRIQEEDQMPSWASTLAALVVREARRRGWWTPPTVISTSENTVTYEEGSDGKQSDH